MKGHLDPDHTLGNFQPVDTEAKLTPRLVWTTPTPKQHHTKIKTYYPQTATTYLCFSLFSLFFICMGVQPTRVPGGPEGQQKAPDVLETQL